jgi:hypothetical protein
MNKLRKEKRSLCKYLIFRDLSPFFTSFHVFFTPFFRLKELIFRRLRKMDGVNCAFRDGESYKMQEVSRKERQGKTQRRKGKSIALRFFYPELITPLMASEAEPCQAKDSIMANGCRTS